MQGRTLVGLAAAFCAIAGIARAGDLPRKDVDKAGRAAWRAVLHWSDDCEEGFDYGDATGGIDVMEIAPHQSIVQVVCTLGAYQGYQHYFLFDETTTPPVAKLLSLRIYGEDEHEKAGFSTTDEIWGRPELDSAKHELVLTNVFRGIGDCGVRSRYRFANGTAELVEVRAHLRCDGKPSEPARWAVVKLP